MNFALILFLLTVVTGVIALADRMLWARNRAPRRDGAVVDRVSEEFFPVLLIVFLLRSFIADGVLRVRHLLALCGRPDEPLAVARERARRTASCDRPRRSG